MSFVKAYVKDASDLSGLAYGDGVIDVSAELLGTDWQYVGLDTLKKYSPDLSDSDFDAQGYFETTNVVFNGFGSAFVAYSNTTNTIALVFRGTDSIADGYLTDVQGGTTDWALILDQYHKLIEAFNNLISSLDIQNVLVTGHSLGGALAEQFLAENYLSNSTSNYYGITFGSPGIQQSAPYLSGNLAKIGHSGDGVFDLTFNDANNGFDVLIDRPDLPDGDIFFTEHRMPTYQSSVNYLAASEFLDEYLRSPGSYDLTFSRTGGTIAPSSEFGHFVIGSSNDDEILGGVNGDLLDGRFGADAIFGFDGNDLISGGPGEDHLVGNRDNDTLWGGADADELDGRDGSDSLDGGTGDDTLVGGTGNDTLDGGFGSETVGGNDTDTAVFSGSMYNYRLGPIEGGYVIYDAYGDDGTDTLIDIEKLQFADWPAGTIEEYLEYLEEQNAGDATSPDLGSDPDFEEPAAPALPDLIATNVSVGSESVEAGGTVDVAYTISNIGSGPATSALAGIYLSADPVITTSDTLYAVNWADSLGSGQIDPEEHTVAVPSTLTPGTYYLGVVADFSGAVDENIESNNRSDARAIKVVAPGGGIGDQPDLTIENVRVNQTSIPYRDDRVVVSWDVVNQGSAAAGQSVAGVFISTDSIITSDDVLLDDNSSGELSAGEGVSESSTFRMSSSISPGTYWIGVVADYERDVKEGIESNNVGGVTQVTVEVGQQPIEISVVPDEPDSGESQPKVNTIADFDIVRVGIGSSIRVNWEVEGWGEHPASPEDFVGFGDEFPSGQETVTNDDLVDGITLSVVDDSFAEFTEGFRVRISLDESNNGDPAVITSAYAYGSILDNDGFIAEGDDYGDSPQTAFQLGSKVDLDPILEQPGDADVFSAYLLADATYTLLIAGSNRGGSDARLNDARLRILNSDLEEVGFTDTNADPIDVFTKFKPPHEGRYFFEVSSSSDVGTGNYQFLMGAFPQDVDGAVSTPGAAFDDELTSAEPVKTYYVGDTHSISSWVISVRSEVLTRGFEDVSVRLFDVSGNPVEGEWVEAGYGVYNIDFAAPGIGTYLLEIAAKNANGYAPFTWSRFLSGGSLEPLVPPDSVPPDATVGTVGDDQFYATSDSEAFFGDAGLDSVGYVLSPTGVDIRLGDGTASGGFADGDTFSSIEHLIGSQYKDHLEGGAAAGTFIQGLGGDDQILGTPFADLLAGGAGNDRLIGKAGNDRVLGGSGNDTLEGGDGEDALLGSAGEDIFDGGAESDAVLYSSSDAANFGPNGVTVNLATGIGIDTWGDVDTYVSIERISGTDQADIFVGNDADNVFRGFDGADVYDGADGLDAVRFDFETGGTGAFVDLVSGAGTDTYGNAETFTSIEYLRGSEWADVLLGNDEDNIFRGLAGADYFDGRGGDIDDVRYDQDARFGGMAGVTVRLDLGWAIDGFGNTDTFDGIERARGTTQDDTFIGAASVDNVFEGNDGADYFDGGIGSFNTVAFRNETGGSGAAVDLSIASGTDTYGNVETYLNISGLRGSRNNDTFLGKAGNDVFRGVAGADYLDGRGGSDGARYDRDVNDGGINGVIVDLDPDGNPLTDDAYAIDGFGDTDTLRSIERIRGTEFDDEIRANTENNFLQGIGGNDTINGADGDDQIEGGEGNDTIHGGNGEDAISGGSGDDSAYGENGDDYFFIDAGVDFIDGGAGIDWLDFQLAASSGVFIDLSRSSGQIVDDGFGSTDTAISIEGVDGSPHADQLQGSAGNDELRGFLGNDQIVGGDGDDVLVGEKYFDGTEAGDDRLTGGGGNDILVGDYRFSPSAPGGNDSLNGGSGHDYLEGGPGDDDLDGGDGADVLNGGVGVDILTLGTGLDLVTGELRELNGDHIVDIAFGEKIVVRNAVLGTITAAASTGVTQLGIDENGDGVNDAVLSLVGTFGRNNFTVETGENETVITLIENNAPTAVDNVVTTNEDVAAVIEASTLLSDDTDIDGHTLRVTSVSNAIRGTVALDDKSDADPTNDEVVFTPDANFSGAASFDYAISDGEGGTDVAKVSLTVAPVNDAPLVAGESASTNEDVALVTAAMALLENDSDLEEDALSVSGVSNAVGGAVILDNKGDADPDNDEVIFTPDANFYGPASFDYTAADGNGGTATTTVTIDVAPVNDAPALTKNAGMKIGQGASGTVIAVTMLTATDIDTTAPSLVYTVTDVPDHGALAVNGIAVGIGSTFTQADIDAELVIYNHDGSAIAADRFEFNLTDGVETVSEQHFDITVNLSLNGAGGQDSLVGGDGEDEFSGGRGNDILDGQAGNDLLNGDDGRDTLKGMAGDDILDGGDGNDILDGGDGVDKLSGGRGNDILDGELGNDLLNGGSGRDTLKGMAGDDILDGGDGNDLLEGGDGNDALVGGDDRDTLKGMAGTDMIIGGSGQDLIDGGSGNDTLTGDSDALSSVPAEGNGTGSDLVQIWLGDLVGGGALGDIFGGGDGDGRDTFIFAPGDGQDTITDFDTGSDSWFLQFLTGDRIDVSAYGFEDDDDVHALAVQDGDDTVIQLSEEDSIRLVGIEVSDLDKHDFIT